MNRADERMYWILLRIVDGKHNGIVAWDEETVDDFVADFPEANATLIQYTLGPCSSPMLNRAARRARDKGYLEPGVIGNQDARSYNQRTWCRYWTLTDDGRRTVTALRPVTRPATTSLQGTENKEGSA